MYRLLSVLKWEEGLWIARLWLDTLLTSTPYGQTLISSFQCRQSRYSIHLGRQPGHNFLALSFVSALCFCILNEWNLLKSVILSIACLQSSCLYLSDLYPSSLTFDHHLQPHWPHHCYFLSIPTKLPLRGSLIYCTIFQKHLLLEIPRFTFSGIPCFL